MKKSTITNDLYVVPILIPILGSLLFCRHDIGPMGVTFFDHDQLSAEISPRLFGKAC